MLSQDQMDRIFSAAGLYGGNRGVLSETDLNACAHYVGAFDSNDDFVVGYERFVALEALRRFKLMASPAQLQPIEGAVNQRIQELFVGPTRPLDGAPPVEPPDANPEWVAEVRALILAVVPTIAQGDVNAHNADPAAHPDLARDGGGGGESSPGSLTSVPLAAPVTLALPATSTASGSASGKPAVWSAWTDLITHTVTEGGFYTLEAELDVSTDFPYGGGGRYFSETRIVRVRGAVTTMLGERDDYHRNFDVGSSSDHWTLVTLDEAEESDQYKVMVRVRRQATAGGSALNTRAANSVWSTNCKLMLLKDGVGGGAAPMMPSGGGQGVPAEADLDNAAANWGLGSDYYLVYDDGTLKKVAQQQVENQIIDDRVEPWARSPTSDDPTRPHLPASEVKTQYESNSDTNAFTDALKARLESVDQGATRNTDTITAAERAKLAGIEPGAEVNPTPAEIKRDYERNADTNAFTNDDKNKLAGIADGAEVNRTAAQLKIDYESNSDTNAFTDEEQRKVANYQIPDGSNDGSKVWKTDTDGNPAWRADAERTNSEIIALINAHAPPGGGGGGLTQDDVDARVAAFTGQDATDPASDFDASRIPLATATEPGGVTAAQHNRIANALQSDDLHSVGALDASQIADDDSVLIEDASVSSGNELRKVTIGELDRRWQGVDANLGILSRAVDMGGIQPWPDDTLQIAGTPRTTPYTSVPSSLNWGNAVVRVGGTAVTPAFTLLRAAKSEFAARPLVRDLVDAGMRFRTGTSESILLQTVTLANLGDNATHWFWGASIPGIPAGDPGITLEQHLPLTLDIEIGAGDVTPASLGVTGDGLLGVSGETFTIEPHAGLAQVWSGSSGVTVTAANAASAIRVVALDQGIDLDTRGSGLLFFDLRVTVPARSQTTLGFGESNATEDTLRGQLSLQLVGFSTAYNPPSALGAVAVRGALYNSGVHVGDFVMRVAKDAQNRLQLVLRYDPQAGHSQSGLSFSIGVQGRVYFLDYGTFAPELGDLGPGYVFMDALPAPAGYSDNDLAVVISGASQGVWVKDSTPTHGVADTGWAGKQIDIGPHGTLQNVDVTIGDDTFRHWRWASAAYQDPRGGGTIQAGGGADPGVTDLWYVDLSYNVDGNRDGRFDIGYTADRTYTGRIDLTIGIYQTLVNRVNNRTWTIRNLTTGSISHLLAGEITVTEPDHVDSTVSPRWLQVAGLVTGTAPLQGTAALLVQGTDALQRTWPALAIAAEIERRATTDAPSAGTPALLQAGVDTVDRVWSAKELADEIDRRDNSRGLLLRSRLPTEAHLLDAETAFPASAVWLCSQGFPPGNSGRTSDADLENRVYVRDGDDLTGWAAATKYRIAREGQGAPTAYTSGRAYARLRDLTTVTLGLFRVRATWVNAGVRYWVIQFRGQINTSTGTGGGTAPAGTPELLQGGTDNANRIWSAKELADEMDRRDNSYGAIAYDGLPPDAVIAGMLAASPEPLWYNTSTATPAARADSARENRTYVQIPPLYRGLFDGYGTSTAYTRSGPGQFTAGGNRNNADAWVRLGGLVLVKGFWALKSRTIVSGLAVVEAEFLGRLPESDSPIIASSLRDLPAASGYPVGKVAIVSSTGAGLYRKNVVSRTYDSATRRFTITPNRGGATRGYRVAPALGSIAPASTTIAEITISQLNRATYHYQYDVRFNAAQVAAGPLDVYFRTNVPPVRGRRQSGFSATIFMDYVSSTLWRGTVSTADGAIGYFNFVSSQGIFEQMAQNGVTLTAVLGTPRAPVGFNFGGGTVPPTETVHSWDPFVAGILPAS